MEKVDLLAIKEQINTAKSKQSELTGQKALLLKQLQEKWKCNSIEEAEKKKKALNSQITKLEKQIEIATQELEEKYDFD